MPVNQPDQYCLLWINWWATCLSKDEWASWVQAIGTLAAVFAAVGLAWWEVRQRRLDSARTSAAYLSARVHKVDNVVTALEAYLENYTGPGYAELEEITRCHQRFQSSVHQVNNIDLVEMPTRSSVRHLRDFQATASIVYERLPRVVGTPIDTPLVEEIQGRLATLLFHRDLLRSESERISR